MDLENFLKLGSIATQAIPTVFGTGDKTTATKQTSTSALGPDAIAALQAGITGGKYSSGQAITDTNAAVNNALQMAFRQFMPRIATAQAGQGIYNSATTDKAVAQATGEATAQSAKIATDQMAQYQQNELNAANVLAGANKSVTGTETTKQAGLIDPMTAAMGMAGLIALNQLGGFSGIGKGIGKGYDWMTGGSHNVGNVVTEGVRKSSNKALDESLNLENILSGISLSPDLSSGSIGKMSLPSWATMSGLGFESPNVGASSFIESPSNTGNVQSGGFSEFMSNFGLQGIMQFFQNLF